MIIRAEQMKVFDEVAQRRFEDEMVVHSREFTPALCEVLGEVQLRVALRQARALAASYGFTFRGPIRLYIEMMFLCGSDFDTDPLYPAVGEILRGPGDQMERAQKLHEGVLDYQEKVAGTNAANVRRALNGLAILARSPFTVTANGFVETMLREMHRIFPERAAYVGDSGLTVLIDEALDQAQKYQFATVRAEALLVCLMFAFGHGCTDDPLYPWIARTLRDDRIVGPEARADRLERKSLTWLDHVLARPEQGTST